MGKVKKVDTISSAQLWLSYFKQGDDMHQCIVEENGKINAKASIENHICLLNHAVSHLEKVKEYLPDGTDFEIDADTHMIMLRGDRTVIEKLQQDGLLQSYDDDYVDESDDSDTQNEDSDYEDEDEEEEEEQEPTPEQTQTQTQTQTPNDTVVI